MTAQAHTAPWARRSAWGVRLLGYAPLRETLRPRSHLPPSAAAAARVFLPRPQAGGPLVPVVCPPWHLRLAAHIAQRVAIYEEARVAM